MHICTLLGYRMVGKSNLVVSKTRIYSRRGVQVGNVVRLVGRYMHR